MRPTPVLPKRTPVLAKRAVEPVDEEEEQELTDEPEEGAESDEFDPLAFELPEMDDMEQERERLDRKGSGQGRMDKLEEGNNRRRILPGFPHWPKRRFYVAVCQHFMGKGKQPLLCRQWHLKKKCRPCEVMDELLKAGNKAAERMRAKLTYWVNVGFPESPEEPVKILPMKKQPMKDFIAHYADMKEWGDPVHPDTGRNSIISKTKTGPRDIDVDYSLRLSPKTTPIPRRWLKQRYDIPALIEQDMMTYQQQVAVMEGNAEDEEEQPRRTRKARPALDGDDDL